MSEFEKVSRSIGMCIHGNYASTCAKCAEASANDALAADLAKLRAMRELSPEEHKDLVRETLKTMIDDFCNAGGEYFVDMNDLYKLFRGREMVVRREEPGRIADVVRKHKDLEIAFDPNIGHKYANAALWRGGSEGLASALQEGFAHAGGLVTVVGFEKGNLDIVDIPTDAKQVGDIDRSTIRSIQGIVPFGDIKFVVVGVPSFLFPKEMRTDREEDRLEEMGEQRRQRVRLFRGFAFNRPAEQEKNAE
jgi:hypothetical protein